MSKNYRTLRKKYVDTPQKVPRYLRNNYKIFTHSRYEHMNWLRDHLKMWNNRNEGLSPFHVACLDNNAELIGSLISQLLAGSKKPIDVNRPVDPSPKSHLAGQSPLHLALNYYNTNDNARLATVDILLKNGANVNVKDVYGETPLHYAVRLDGEKKFNILKIILEAGADVNAYRSSGGIPGVTALDYLLCHGYYSAELLELFVKHGSRFNAYNPLDEGGYVAVAFVGCGYESDEKKILFKAMRDHPHTIEPDEQGRTVIHSLVAHPGTSLDLEEYVKLIEELVTLTGCDVNDQDKKGRTALYLAAHHGNGRAIEALLIAGADINITDNDGKVAFDYLKRHGTHAFNNIAKQVKKLELLELDVGQKNIDLAQSVRLDEASFKIQVQTELELAKYVQVVLPSLTLRHFLYEMSSKATAAIIGNHAAIQEFFENFEDRRFEELRTLFKLQYRKAVARSKLLEPAAVALDLISGCTVLISEMIVRFLKNDDLKRLIEASAFMQ